MERKKAPQGTNSLCVLEQKEERDTHAFLKQSVPEHICHPCPQSQLQVRTQACDISNHFTEMLLKPTSVYKSQPHMHKYRIYVEKLKSQSSKQKKTKITCKSIYD